MKLGLAPLRRLLTDAIALTCIVVGLFAIALASLAFRCGS